MGLDRIGEKIGLATEICSFKETRPLEIQSNEGKSLVISVPPTNKKISRFKLINPDGGELKNESLNLTNSIIKNWGKRDISNEKLLDLIEVTKIFDSDSILTSKKDINKLKALDNVSFSIFEGESFGLVGESGSGKSTIAKIITNLIKPTLGEVFYGNISIFGQIYFYHH